MVTLSDVLRALAREGRRLSPATAVALILRVLDVLDRTAHDGPRGDLSPDVVQLDRAGNITLEHAQARPELALRYQPPEQARRLPIDARSDLYAVGVLAWELLTSRAMVGGLTQADLLEALRAPPPPTPPSRYAPEVPRALDAAVVALLALEPHERPRNVSEARHRLIAAMPDALKLTAAELASLVDHTPTPRPELERRAEVHAMVEALTLGQAAVTPAPDTTYREQSQTRGRIVAQRRRDLLLIGLFVAASVVVVGVLVLVLGRT